MANSSVSPESIFIRKIENNAVHLLVRWNIEEIETIDDNGTRIEYEYDEQKLVVTILDDIMSPSDLKAWIAENSSDLLKKAKDMVTPTAKAPKADNIRDMSIIKVRSTISVDQ